jgi:hypothetical protein
LADVERRVILVVVTEFHVLAREEDGILLVGVFTVRSAAGMSRYVLGTRSLRHLRRHRPKSSGSSAVMAASSKSPDDGELRPGRAVELLVNAFRALERCRERSASASSRVGTWRQSVPYG